MGFRLASSSALRFLVDGISRLESVLCDTCTSWSLCAAQSECLALAACGSMHVDGVVCVCW